jgi:NADH:ubiquinone oxidoreductase subunit H
MKTNWEVEAEKGEEKFEYDIKLDIRCLVQDLIGFLMATWSSILGYKIRLSEIEINLSFLFLGGWYSSAQIHDNVEMWTHCLHGSFSQKPFLFKSCFVFFFHEKM